MGRTAIALVALLATSVSLSACGSNEVLGPPEGDPSDPLILVQSQGGFVPVEWNLGRGPVFSLTRGGELTYQGVTTLEYPGALLPPYMVVDLDDDQMAEVTAHLEKMGIAGIDDERDDTQQDHVADATTEVITYWDEDGGTHRYSVYALGIDDDPASEATAAFGELLDYLHDLAATLDAAPLEVDRYQIVAGADYEGPDPDFIDIRPWPLDGENPDLWSALTTVGESQAWSCKVFDGPIPSVFEEATQATLWMHPVESGDAQNFKLLIRPLLPGEDACTV